MHFDFSSAIDNARLLAERAAALRRGVPPPMAARRKPSRWCALPLDGRAESRSPAAGLKPAAGGSPAHAH